ncbi:hypothetical protein [Companilactobacillus jidongensis]|uniref:hypothetical protein n=1 Tax=Companilactobacillus jidongensis TaxID=2486006 RepID=UPI000F78BC8D|nr:hypothetical protein [Companilactobacillus jidongensis]
MDIFNSNLTPARKLQILHLLLGLTGLYAVASLLFGDSLKNILTDKLFIFLLFSNLVMYFKYLDKKDKYYKQTAKIYFIGFMVFLIMFAAKALI